MGYTSRSCVPLLDNRVGSSLFMQNFAFGGLVWYPHSAVDGVTPYPMVTTPPLMGSFRFSMGGAYIATSLLLEGYVCHHPGPCHLSCSGQIVLSGM
jgi:hypothetical protein